MPGIDDRADRIVATLARKLADDARRNRNRMRRGRVVAADPEKGLYRLELRPADGERPAFWSPWLRVAAMAAGGVKVQAEPTLGQWVMLMSESGEFADAVIVLSSYFDDEPRPHDKNGELVTTIGDAYREQVDKDGAVTGKAKSRVHETEGDVEHKVGGDLVQKADGKLTIGSKLGIDFDNGGAPTTFGGGGIVRFT